MDTKRCTKCKRQLPETAFRRLSSGRQAGRLTSRCIECLVEDMRGWRERHQQPPTRHPHPRTEPKKCARCRETLPPDAFYTYTLRGVERLHSWCKTCLRVYEKEHRKAPPSRSPKPPTTERACTRCHTTKLITDFYISSKGRPSSWCKICHRKYAASRASTIKVTEKPCVACGVVLQISEFCRDRARPDGHQEVCRACQSSISKAKRLDPDFREKMRAQYQTLQARARSFFYQMHRSRRGMQREVDPAMTRQVIEGILAQPCYYCGRSNTTGLDRVDNDKGYLIANVVPCCPDCNRAKRQMSITDFINLCKLVAANHLRTI